VSQHDEVAFWCGEPLGSVGINGIELDESGNSFGSELLGESEFRDGFSAGGAGSSDRADASPFCFSHASPSHT